MNENSTDAYTFMNERPAICIFCEKLSHKNKNEYNVSYILEKVGA